MNLRIITAVGAALWMLSAPVANALVPGDLRATPEPNKLGLTFNEYRFSWHAPDQRGYQVLAASDDRRLALDIGDLWDSGRRVAWIPDKTTNKEKNIRSECLCRGKAFPAGSTVWWKVRCWDREGKPGDWSAAQKIEVPRPTATEGKIDDSSDIGAVVIPGSVQNRIVLLGGSFIYGMERHGHFETAVTARWPHHNITFRNLGWPGDDVFGTARGEFQSARGPGSLREAGSGPGAGYQKLLSQVRAAEPTTLIVGHGAEAAYAETEDQMNDFRTGYRRLIEDLEQTGAKLILVTPILQGKTGVVAAQVPARNERLKEAAAFIREFAKDRGHATIDLQKDSLHDNGIPLFRNAIDLTRSGYQQISGTMAHALGVNEKIEVSNRPSPDVAAHVWGEGMRAEEIEVAKHGLRFNLTLDQLPTTACEASIGSGDGLYHNGELAGHGSQRIGTGMIERGPDVAQAEQLRKLIVKKNAYHRARLRPLNKTYIFLFRSHEMGHFAHEMEDYEQLIEGTEEQIALLRVPQPHRHEFRSRPQWSAPREYPDEEVPKDIPAPNVEEELTALTVAEGFKVNLFASDPMIANPINLNWDVRGRAWVSTSSTYPHPRPGQEPNDRIVILEDANGDGVADKHTVFAEGLLVPHSVMPVPGGAYVCSATELLFLVDADSDGVSESRQVVFSGFGNADVHHMIHGLRWSPWGDLHFTQSIYINSFVDTPYGPRRMNGSGIWRFRPETWRLEPFATGMVNPWGFAFDRWGQSFGTDGAAGQGPHYVFPGSAFRSAVGPHRVLDGLIPGKPNNTGGEFVSGRHLPDHWQESFLGNDFRANRTVRYELQASGSGYSAKEVETVLHSSHRSFRPVDIKMGPEGAVYVVDWYNAIIDHGEVDFYHPLRDKSHGRIWRITAKDRPLVERPVISGAPVEDLIELLKAPEDYTRVQAKRELASRPCQGILGPISDWVASLDPVDPQFEHHRLEALWLLMAHRAATPGLLQAILHSPSPQARAAAVRAVSTWDSRAGKINQLSHLEKAVEDEHPQVRLEAVNGLRALGTLEAANLALRALSHPTDNNLNFALELTVRQLRDQWLPAMQSGKQVFDGDPSRLSYALEEVNDPRAISRLVQLATTGAIEEEGLSHAVATIAALGDAQDLEAAIEMAKNKPEFLSAIARGAMENRPVPASSQDVINFLAANEASVIKAAIEPIAIACVRRAHASGREMDRLITALNKAGNLEPLAQNLTVEQRRELLHDVSELGDVARGREIFERKALACTTCHQVDNQGGKVGPDLTAVGTYATPESLLESLLNPSTTVKQGYETVILTKKDQTMVAGLLQRKTETATLVRDPSGKVIAIPGADIAEIERSPISLMPPGLTASLRRDELIDLMRYLTSLGIDAR